MDFCQGFGGYQKILLERSESGDFLSRVDMQGEPAQSKGLALTKVGQGGVYWKLNFGVFFVFLE